MTNSSNAVIVALATASIGGIFSSTATDMGTQVRSHNSSITGFYNAVSLGCLGSISSDSAQVCVCRNRGIICWQGGQPSSKNWRRRQRPVERRLTTCNSASKPYIWTRTPYPGYVEQVDYSYLYFL